MDLVKLELESLFRIRDALRILYGYGYTMAGLLKEVEEEIELKIRSMGGEKRGLSKIRV